MQLYISNFKIQSLLKEQIQILEKLPDGAMIIKMQQLRPPNMHSNKQV